MRRGDWPFGFDCCTVRFGRHIPWVAAPVGWPTKPLSPEGEAYRYVSAGLAFSPGAQPARACPSRASPPSALNEPDEKYASAASFRSVMTRSTWLGHCGVVTVGVSRMSIGGAVGEHRVVATPAEQLALAMRKGTRGGAVSPS